MAKRLRMTTADYLAIAVSPALIMTLVGSLVYFLIEVFYAGEYQARLNYVFALFVFSAVLIARISIEMGSERASIFALALGIATFLVLQKFVEHPSSSSTWINLGLIGIVWWCAHQLTWDCTLIDDNEDASGEGLLQRIGVDEPEEAAAAEPLASELLTEAEEARIRSPRWWRLLPRPKKGPHTPGLWVLYFSMAALPWFGIGQHWIPASDVGRRRYAFGLLAVYVFSALALLVTTSFLGLRRYLRQRRLEMPASMAATWVGLGGVLILLVMFAAALVPRPAAEVAISQVPWQAGSPAGVSSSRYGRGNDGMVDPDTPAQASVNDSNASAGEVTNETGQPEHSDNHSSETRSANDSSESGGRNGSEDASDAFQPDQSGDQSDGQAAGRPSANGNVASSDDPPSSSSSQPSDGDSAEARAHDEQAARFESLDERHDAKETGDSQQQHPATRQDAMAGQPMDNHGRSVAPQQLPQQIFSSLVDFASLLKLLFYAIAGLAILYFLWRNWRRLWNALGEIWRELAQLFGMSGRDRAGDKNEGPGPLAVRRRSFSEFRDPFRGGVAQRETPAELVRYTFEAFEAWAADHGTLRRADQTPQELLNCVAAPQTELYGEGGRLIAMYNAIAYAGAKPTHSDVERLSRLWRLMAAESQLARWEVSQPAS